MASGKLVVEILENGELKLNARELVGGDAELLEELQGLAVEVTGSKDSLVVEKHVHRHGHSHSHGDKVHTH